MPRSLDIPNSTIDSIWEAVEDAISSGMTPKQFKLEVAEAWISTLHHNIKYAEKELRKEL